MSMESSNLGCGICKYVRYDSWFDEHWCTHKPKPNGLCSRFIVSVYDKCEYFKEEDHL